MKDYPENRKKLNHGQVDFRPIGEPSRCHFFKEERKHFYTSLVYEMNHIFVTSYILFAAHDQFP